MNDEPVNLPAPAAPAVLERLIQQAERAGASDIHFQMRGKTAEVSASGSTAS